MSKSLFGVTRKPPHAFTITCDLLVHLMEWLIDNTYVVVGNQVLQQTIGIPMGTHCAPFLANLFLFAYEFRYLNNLLKDKNFTVLYKFYRCARYIDDLFLVNNNKFLASHKYDV